MSCATHGTVVSLATRPVLFALARALAEAWPGDVPRDALVARAFGAKHADESHRARLRVEIGRLRAVLRTLAGVSATKRGFALAPRRAREVVVLARPVEEEHAAVLAFLADGEVVVELGAGAGARRQPAHRAAGARRACGSRQGAVVRPRAGAPLDDAAGAGIHDDLVTPRSAAGRLGLRTHEDDQQPKSSANTDPFRASTSVHGVTYRRPARLVCLRRQAERASIRRAARRCARSTSPRMPERPSTASTCSRSPRIASRRSIRRPAACSPRSRRPAAAATRASPGPKARSGSGSIATGRSIRSIPRPGRSCAPSSPTASSPASPGSTASSGTAPGKATRASCGASIRERARCWRRLEMPPGVGVSGLESDGGDRFFCGGGSSGKVRAVRRPRRGSRQAAPTQTNFRRNLARR